MDTKEIVRLYVEEKWTLRMVAEKMNTDHHSVKRILQSFGVEITKRKTLKPRTDDHKRKIGLASLGRQTNLGKKMPKSSLYKNMKAHLAFDVSVDWLLGFSDVERLKFLNKSISRERDRVGFTDEVYKMFIEKFYNDPQFNHVYDKWVSCGKNKWYKPSLDHINPKSKKGSLTDINNLQFITWLENRAKADIPAVEWENIKERIQDYFV